MRAHRLAPLPNSFWTALAASSHVRRNLNCADTVRLPPRHRYAHAVAETSYASCGDLSLAYQVFGDGPVELVFVGPMVSHIELFWTLPEFKAFFDQLATFCRVVLFDKAGVGLSDPIPKVRTLEERAAEIEAVMDAVGFGKAAVFGMSEGGPAGHHVRGKTTGANAGVDPLRLVRVPRRRSWDDLDRDPAELRARCLPEMGEEYTPSTKQIGPPAGNGPRRPLGVGQRRDSQVDVPVGPVDAPARPCSSACAPARGWCERQWNRTSGSTSGRSCRRSPCPPWSSMPATTLMPVQCGRYLADHIPGARYLEVDGADHAPWFTEPDTILTGIEEFLTGSHAAPSQSHRALRTVLFTDMVASTQHAAAAGDERWRAVLQRFGEITADLTQRFGGTVVKSTGDGHLATFDGPTQAIRCAEALAR